MPRLERNVSRILILFLFFALSCSGGQKRAPKSEASAPIGGPQSGVILVQEEEEYFDDPALILGQTEMDLSTRQTAARQMVQEDQAGSVEILFQACQTEARLLSKEVLAYFGEKKYIKAIPMIKKTVESSNDPEIIYTAFYALAQMETNETDSYILDSCKVRAEKKAPYYRYQCFLAAHDTDNKSLKRKGLPIFKEVQKDPKVQGDSKLQKLIADFLNANDKQGSSSLAKAKTPPPPKKPAPAPIARPKPALPSTALKPVPPKSRISSTKKKKRTRLPLGFKGLRSILAKRIGNKKASLLLDKIHESLQRHAERKSDIRDFLVRAYQRYSPKRNLSPEQAQKLIGIGVHYPGGLRAVVKNIKREYKETPLRSYVLSKIFKISRSHGKLSFF